jgi:hypothetical protein
MRRSLALLIALVVSTLGAGVALAGSDHHDRRGFEVQAEMDGSQVVPGPGDPDGDVEADLTLFVNRGRVCFEIDVEDIRLPATAADVHQGKSGEVGPSVISLTPPDQYGKSEGCVSVDPALLRQIRMNPPGYYVDVHNESFPDGAIRGQLDEGHHA